MDYYTGKDYGPGQGMAYTAVEPKDGFQYKYGEDGTRYSVPMDVSTQLPNQLPGFGLDERRLIQPVASPTDQEIRDEGLKFMPQQKYLQKPFEFPTKEIEEKGITNTDAFTNSGNDGFDVYNPNPDSISNRDYNPYRYQEATDKNFTRPEKSKFQEMLSKGINFIPGANIAKKGLDVLGNMLPINRRAIMENELSGQGIMVNDIGQIVSDGGNINTTENIMAGYNASKVDKDTFKKRRLMIEQKMKNKEQKAAKLKALNAAETKMLGTATDRTNKIFDLEEEEKNKKKQDNFLLRFLNKKKETKTSVEPKTAAAATGSSYTASGDDNITDRRESDYSGSVGLGSNANAVRSAMRDNDPNTGSAQSYNQNLASGGRAGYFFGGRAGYAEGGAIYPRLGTLSSGVQSAEQQLQGINASLQKAESDLGSDSPGGGSSMVGGPSFTSNFEDANNQGPGSSLLFGGSMDQASPITAPTTPSNPNVFKDPVTGGGQPFYGSGDKPIKSPMPVPGNPELAGPLGQVKTGEFRAGTGNETLTGQALIDQVRTSLMNRAYKSPEYIAWADTVVQTGGYPTEENPGEMGGMMNTNEPMQPIQSAGGGLGGLPMLPGQNVPQGGMNFTERSLPQNQASYSQGYTGQLPGFSGSGNFNNFDPTMNKGIGSIL